MEDDGKITLTDVVALGYAASEAGVEKAHEDGLITLAEFRWLRDGIVEAERRKARSILPADGRLVAESERRNASRASSGAGRHRHSDAADDYI